MIRFHPDSTLEGFEAEEHYAAESSEAAARFRKSLADALSKIASAPLRWPQDDDGFRRYKLIDFPYLIFYEPAGEDIQIYAIAHGARKPGYWHGRAGR